MRGKSFLVALVVGLAVVVGAAQIASGAGFALYEGSARGNALGGALVGRADDPSALFYNPAGITQLPGLQVAAGATAIMPGTKVTTQGVTSDARGNVWFPPHFYTTYQYSDRLWFGFGAFSPFGLGVEFDPNWPGAYNNIKTVITTLNMNPNVAFKLNDQLSMAVGLNVMYFDLEMKRTVNPIPRIDTDLRGDSFGYGLNVAFHYKPTDWLSAGVSYRSRVSQHLSGTGKFSPNFFVFTDTNVHGAITLPDEVYFGVAVKPCELWSIEAGLVWMHWSTYHDLSITFDNLLGTQSTLKNWHDTMRYNLGVEYKANKWLDLRAGYVYDEEPIPADTADFIVPANDRHNFCVGSGFHFGSWNVDVSYTYIFITDRTIAERPTLHAAKISDGDAHLVGLTVGYKF